MNDHQLADLEYWDRRELLTVSEIAWLWCGLEPPRQGRMYWKSEGPPPPPPYPPFSRAETIVHELLVANKDPRDPLTQVDNHPDKIVGVTAFLRADVRAWAERNGYRPAFLFPEIRKEKPMSGKREETYLTLIAALLLRLDDEDSELAPYALARKLIDSATSAGLETRDEDTYAPILIKAKKFLR